MLKKIRDFLLEMLFAPSGPTLLVFCIMLLLSIFNLINTKLLLSSNALLLLMVPISFLLPLFPFWLSRGGKKYVPTHHLELPKKAHIKVILLSGLTLIFGSTLLKLFFIGERYTEFHLYQTFFANRSGNIFNDIYLLLAFCIVPPLFEALVFRGVFITEHDRRGRLSATIVSSLFFALLGFDFAELPQRFFMGALLCAVLYATESIAATAALHIVYNFYAVFVEPTLISLKSVSSSYELFLYGWAICALLCVFLLLLSLSKLYKKYSHDRFGENFVRSTPKERTLWHLVELLLSIPALACYVLFAVVTMLVTI